MEGVRHHRAPSPEGGGLGRGEDRTMSANDFVRAFREGTARLTAAYGYNPGQEMDSCGVGLIAALDGRQRRDVVVAGIDALKAVWHRGAVDADGKTGDGA